MIGLTKLMSKAIATLINFRSQVARCASHRGRQAAPLHSARTHVYSHPIETALAREVSLLVQMMSPVMVEATLKMSPRDVRHTG